MAIVTVGDTSDFVMESSKEEKKLFKNNEAKFK